MVQRVSRPLVKSDCLLVDNCLGTSTLAFEPSKLADRHTFGYAQGVTMRVWLIGAVLFVVGLIASVPVKRLVELSGYKKLRWSFVDGWLILESF
jgi:hypothetical protein